MIVLVGLMVYQFVTLNPVSDFITSPLVHIINNSINKRIFPDAWEIARVCPIPKVDHPKNITEYKPISVLPILSKVYERVILNQLLSFFKTSAKNVSDESLL